MQSFSTTLTIALQKKALALYQSFHFEWFPEISSEAELVIQEERRNLHIDKWIQRRTLQYPLSDRTSYLGRIYSNWTVGRMINALLVRFSCLSWTQKVGVMTHR